MNVSIYIELKLYFSFKIFFIYLYYYYHHYYYMFCVMCRLKFNHSLQHSGHSLALQWHEQHLARPPKRTDHTHIPLVAVDLLRVCNAILPELQNHLRTFPHSLVIALTAGQEVWVLLLKVWVVEDQGLCSDGNGPARAAC